MVGSIQFRFITLSVLVVIGMLATVVGSQAGTVSGEPIDSDGDGFSDAAEEFIGTDFFDNCADNRGDDAWPPDLDNDRGVDVDDIMKFKRFVKDRGGASYKPRYDLNTDGMINILDVLTLKPYYGTSCT